MYIDYFWGKHDSKQADTRYNIQHVQILARGKIVHRLSCLLLICPCFVILSESLCVFTVRRKKRKKKNTGGRHGIPEIKKGDLVADNYF